MGDDCLTMPGPPAGHLGRTMGLRPPLKANSGYGWEPGSRAGWPVGYAWASWLTFSAFSLLAYPPFLVLFSSLLLLVAPVLHPSPIQSSSHPPCGLHFCSWPGARWEAVQDSGWTCNVVC